MDGCSHDDDGDLICQAYDLVPKTLLVLCGLPAAGKSTLARALVAAQGSTTLSPVVHCELDVLMGPDQDWSASAPGLWSAMRARALESLEQCVSASPPGAVVVVDDNMYYRSMRNRVCQLARAGRHSFATIHVTCPGAVAMERNAARDRPVPVAVLQRMAARIEPPAPGEVSWEVTSAVVDGCAPFELQLPIVAKLVYRARCCPLHPLHDRQAEQNLDRQTTISNAVHQCDLRLRRQLAQIILTFRPGHSALQTSAFAAHLSRQRRRLLQEARSTFATMPPDDAHEDIMANLVQQLPLQMDAT